MRLCRARLDPASAQAMFLQSSLQALLGSAGPHPLALCQGALTLKSTGGTRTRGKVRPGSWSCTRRPVHPNRAMRIPKALDTALSERPVDMQVQPLTLFTGLMAVWRCLCCRRDGGPAQASSSAVLA